MKIYVVNELDIDDYDGEYTRSYCHSAFADLKMAKSAQELIVNGIVEDFEENKNYDITTDGNVTRIVFDNFIYIVSIEELDLLILNK